MPLNPGSDDANDDAGAGAMMMQDMGGKKEMGYQEAEVLGSGDSQTLAGSEGVDSDQEGMGVKAGRK